jgi:hypothetical protein
MKLSLHITLVAFTLTALGCDFQYGSIPGANFDPQPDPPGFNPQPDPPGFNPQPDPPGFNPQHDPPSDR